MCVGDIKVGDGVTVCYWTDRQAYTVIKRTAKTLTLQRDKCTRDFEPEWIVGGFAAHCTNNNDQKWKYETDPNGSICKAYWKPSRGKFYVDGTLGVIKGRHEFYDYNF